MQTILGQKKTDTTSSAFKSYLSSAPVSTNHIKSLKIREFISWSVCFAIVSGLTGLMKFLNVGLTMDTITSILFYLSLGGLAWFVYKIFLLSRNPVRGHGRVIHDLN
jgi:hypothetical protein